MRCCRWQLCLAKLHGKTRLLFLQRLLSFLLFALWKLRWQNKTLRAALWKESELPLDYEGNARSSYHFRWLMVLSMVDGTSNG